jgi:uroporphyrinogen decarboxylase
MGNHAIHVSGIPVSDCYTNAVAMATAQLAAWRLYQQDVIVVQSDNYYMAEAFGARIVYQTGGMPAIEEPVVTDHATACSLKVADPKRDGRMHVYIEAEKRIVDAVGDNAAIRGCGTGPFVVAGHMLGLERLLYWIAETEAGIEDHGEALDSVMRVALETLVAYATAQLEAGCTIIQLADSTASLNMISPLTYRTRVFPWECEFFSRIAPVCRRYDACSLLHICGDNSEVLDLHAATGADIVAVDHAVDLPSALRAFDNRCCAIGNINPSGALLFGTPQEVSREASVCLSQAKGHRYLLGTGCEVAPKTPVANMSALPQSVHACTTEVIG